MNDQNFVHPEAQYDHPVRLPRKLEWLFRIAYGQSSIGRDLDDPRFHFEISEQILKK